MNTKKAKAAAEIIAALLVIIVIYCLIRFMEGQDVEAQTGGVDTQVQVSVADREEGSDNFGTVTLGKRQYRLSHPVKTYLFLGTDASGNEDGVGDEYHGAMADVLMLLIVDEQEEAYGVLQLNRDTITPVSILYADGSYYDSAEIQICIAHWYGGNKKIGCENTVDAVSNLLGGIEIDGYYALSMEAMELLNQSVDGVTVTFSEDLTELDPAMKEGATLTLTDEQAMRLMRARMDMADDRNSERMHRQQIFLDAFLAEVREKTAEDSDFIIYLYDSLHPYSTESININELTNVFKQMGSYTSRGILSIDGESKIGQTLGDGEDHWEFYPDEDSLDETMNALYPLEYEKDIDEESEE